MKSGKEVFMGYETGILVVQDSTDVWIHERPGKRALRTEGGTFGPIEIKFRIYSERDTMEGTKEDKTI